MDTAQSQRTVQPRGPGAAPARCGRGPAARIVGACQVALLGAAAAQGDAPRLLTGLSAEAGPGGVVLSWTVDEARAHLIGGFTCVYLTPSHLRWSVHDTAPCGAEPSPSTARSRTVSGLPEYGEYLFEVVAEVRGGAGVGWPLRALHHRIEVTEALAGPPGPTRAVTGEGPRVEGCGPDDDSMPPWSRDRIVSAAHLTHYPGQGWRAGGDPGADPEWPQPTPIVTLIENAGVELAEAFATQSGAEAAARALLREPHFELALARAGDGTKALLRRRADGAHELKLHSGYPFGSTYVFGTEHAVSGWGDADHAATWPGLWNRVDCPPPEAPRAYHDVALALSNDAGGGRRLAHAGYGWWTVAPVGVAPERIVAGKAGLSFGAPADAPPGTGSRWRGRLSGHLFFDKRRWALAGDATIEAGLAAGKPTLSGRIDNIVLAPLDARRLLPAAGAPGRLPALVLRAGPAEDGAWSGAARIGAAEAGAAPEGLPDADAFRGDWLAAVHGPGAAEVAGRLRLWTELAEGADGARDWPSQAVLVAGFGAVRTQGERP